MKQDVYMNRELSWLKFNERVLEEAENEQVHQILKAVRKLNARKDAAYETLMEKLEESVSAWWIFTASALKKARIWKCSLTQRFCLFFHLRSWENVSRSHF